MFSRLSERLTRKALGGGGLWDNTIGTSLVLTRVRQTPGSTSCCHLEDRENFLRLEENRDEKRVGLGKLSFEGPRKQEKG